MFSVSKALSHHAVPSQYHCSTYESAIWDSTIMTTPSFLRLSLPEKRSRFYAISSKCEERVEKALLGEDSAWSFSQGLQPQNKARNRYVNVLPWDSTRVKLTTKNGKSDYINASWVQLGRNKYIAAQGPLNNTIHHFWAMCFQQAQQQSDILIAMVTPLYEQGREKCAKYWPSKEDPVWDLSGNVSADGLFEEMKLTWVSETLHGESLLTHLELECDGIRKHVLHHYYRGWADTQKPSSTDPLVALSGQIAKAKQNLPDLVPIVHCSAGVGRTGTFIALDHFLTSDVLSTESEDPVMATVSAMREHRIMMVQTVHQYMFLYEAAKAFLTSS